MINKEKILFCLGFNINWMLIILLIYGFNSYDYLTVFPRIFDLIFEFVINSYIIFVIINFHDENIKSYKK